MTITDIVIGPCDRNMLKSQPTIGRSTSASGGSNDVERARAAARSDEAVQVAGQAERDDVDDRAADDLVGAHADRQPGVQTETSIPAPIAASTPTSKAGVNPKIARLGVGHRLVDHDRP